jgi:hypothetical protein
LGFPVSGELARRHRKVQLIVGFIYLGVPLLLLPFGLWCSGGAWTGAVVPLALLALGASLVGRHRYQPQRWRATSAFIGAVAGLFLTLAPYFLGSESLVFFLLAVLSTWWIGLLAGVAVAAYAERVLLVPVDPELADTPYQLVFRLRGLWRTTLVLGTDTVGIQSVPRKFRGVTPDDLGRTYPLAKVTGIHEVSLTGSERLRFPIALPAPAVRTAGPAVILQVAGDDWVLPTNLAPSLTQLLQHRVDGASAK